MKTLTIKTRKVLERTGYKKYPFKEILQFKVTYGNVEVANAKVDETKIKIPFAVVLKTRSKKELENYIARLGRTDGEKNLKEVLINLVK